MTREVKEVASLWVFPDANSISLKNMTLFMIKKSDELMSILVF